MSVLNDSVKMKFAGFLRGLLRRVGGSENTKPRKQRPATAVAAPIPTAPAPAPAAVSQPQLIIPVTPAPPLVENISELEMPLLPILEKLPADLRFKMTMAAADLSQASISISIEKILPQLALGTVKISFGELRRAAPGLFRVGEEYDSLPAALPLNEVLLRLSPALLARNPAQKVVEAPPEISGPFGAQARGVSFATSLLKPAVPATPSTTHFFRKTAPEPELLKVQPPLAAPLKMQQPTPSAQHATTPAPIVPALKPATPTASPQAPIPAQTPIPFLKPVAPAAPQTVSAAAATILAPLAAFSENWPEPLRLEIAQLNLKDSQVALPVHLIEPAMKRGRAIFSWHHLRSWIRPTPPGVSIHDATELELPLKVLAPLFLSRQKAAANGKIALPPSNVPNLFFGFPQPQPEELAAPLNAPQAVPVVKAVDAKLAETNYYVWGDAAETPRVDEADFKRLVAPATDFSNRRAMPKEIVERAMQLSGVAGAIVALPDGLKVAHQLPSDLNADTVAAFLPQLFSRVNQCSKELRMGELNNLNFTVGNVPWKIFRVSAVYFAAFGRVGEPLPTAQLAALAGELGKK